MKLYEKYAHKDYHSSIISTFGIDFEAYENIVLSRTRGAGCHNNLLIADARMLTLALDGASALPQHAGRLYSITGARSEGVFHPKITVQLGRSKGRAIVSSANMTAAGLAGNFELGGVIECGTEPSGEGMLVASAFHFLTSFLDTSDPTIRRQLDWLLARTPWLRQTQGTTASVQLSDGSRAAFLASGQETGIARRFINLVGGQDVTRLVVVSPYWDHDLHALTYLSRTLAARETVILLDPDKHQFPVAATGRLPTWKMLGFGVSAKEGGVAWREERFVHAKLLIAQTEQADHVLFGSANCTISALGNADFAGTNAEACFYRALPPGDAIRKLGLTDILEAAPLDTSLISSPADNEIPLQHLEQRNPGRFSCQYDTLTWHLPPRGTNTGDTLELMGQTGAVLNFELENVDAENPNERRFRLIAKERPHFARIRYVSGQTSAPAVVQVLDLLRDSLRDARSKKIDAAIAGLNDETDVSLWLLQTIGELEAAERQRTQSGPIKRAKSERESQSGDGHDIGNVIEYDAFVAGRHLRSESINLSRSSLGGTDFSRVRNFLNRILSIEPGRGSNDKEHEADLAKALATQDEVTDADEAPEQDAVLPPRKPDLTDDEKRAEQLRSERRRANREQLIDAVTRLIQSWKERTSFTPVDLLRLRAMLMILLAAAWEGKGKPSSLLHVLPAGGDKDAAWPRLLGKCLFAFFGGNTPAVRRLTLEDCYDQIPDDILECWASCFWVVQVITQTAARTDKMLLQHFKTLPRDVYARTGLRTNEFSDPRVLKTFDGLSARFSGPLKLDPEQLRSGHSAVASSFKV